MYNLKRKEMRTQQTIIISVNHWVANPAITMINGVGVPSL
jgi:hypothetical protein